MRAKNFFKGLVAAFALVCCATTAQAQTGIGTVGVAAGFASYNDGGYANVFLQCDIVPHVRIVPEIGYIFRNNGKEGFEASVDAQMPFTLARGFSIYPLVGITYNYWKYHPYDSSVNRVGVDLGAGFDVKLASNLKLIVQGKASLMNDTSGGFFTVGFGYMF